MVVGAMSTYTASQCLTTQVMQGQGRVKNPFMSSTEQRPPPDAL